MTLLVTDSLSTPKVATEVTKEDLASFQAKRERWMSSPRPKLKPLPPPSPKIVPPASFGSPLTMDFKSPSPAKAGQFAVATGDKSNTSTSSFATSDNSTTSAGLFGKISLSSGSSGSFGNPTFGTPSKSTSSPFGVASVKAPALASFPPSSSKAPTPFGKMKSPAPASFPPSSTKAPTPFGQTKVPAPAAFPTSSTTASTSFSTLSSNQSSGGLDYKARLTEFYQKHNPSKVDTVDATLAKYKGKEEDLFQKLKAKYEGSSTSADKSGFALPSGEGPLCFLKFSVNGKPAGRVVVKLFQDKTPLAAENFKCLCTGEKGMGRLGKPLCYKNSQVHRIVPNFCVQMGDFTKGNGTGGESIYSPNSEHGDAWGKFKDEAFMQHSKPGLLSMANSGKNTNSSQVFFTLRAVPYLDGKHVVFGEVVEGMDVIESLGKLETNAKQNPVQPVEIMECGEVVDGTDVPSQQPKQSSPFLNPSSMFSLSAPVSAFGSTGSSAFGTAGSNLSSTGSPFGFGNSFASTSLFGQSQPTIKPVSEASSALQQQPSSQATTSGALTKANSGAFPPSSSKAPTPFGQGKLILSLMAILASALILPVSSFLPGKKIQRMSRPRGRFLSTQQFLFDKLFEEEGVLGKGVTVGKISVALRSPDRSDTSIFGLLESHAADDSDANEDLARMANNVCLDLMRKSDDWVAACSSSKWFSGKDAGKAESYYNDLSNNEAVKFEKEYVPDEEDENDGGPTLVVVTLVLEIQGDSTTFEGAGYSISQTKEVLASIASDCLVDDGYCVNAVEVFWTPSDRNEVLVKNDIILDFPELIDL